MMGPKMFYFFKIHGVKILQLSAGKTFNALYNTIPYCIVFYTPFSGT